MGVNIDIATEVEVVCTCGRDLDLTAETWRGKTTLTIHPCEFCMAEMRETGREEGLQEGR